MTDPLGDAIRAAGRTPVPEDQVPDDERMTRGELRAVIHFLGINQGDLGRIAGVNDRTARAWCSGRYPIPDRVRIMLEEIEDRTADAVAQLVTALRDVDEPFVVLYERDEEMWAERPDLAPLPARWWSQVVMRAALEVPGVAMGYRPDTEA